MLWFGSCWGSLSRFWIGLRLRFGLWFLDFLSEGVCDEFLLRKHIILHLTSSVVRVLREVPVACMVILFFGVVAFHVVSRMISRVLVMVNTSLLIEIIIVRIGHWII